MKIGALADLHGKLPKVEESLDVLCLVGDLLSHDNYNRNIAHNRQEDWFKRSLLPYLKGMKCNIEYILLIAGNHDVYFDSPEFIDWCNSNLLDGRIKYLKNTSVLINDVKFFGTPDTFRESGFGDWWSFAESPESLTFLYEELIPQSEPDILLSHCPPYHILDFNDVKSYYGSKEFKYSLDKGYLDNIPYCFCGHIHEQGGKIQKYRNTQFINCAEHLTIIEI